MPSNAIEIREVGFGKEAKPFLQVPFEVYKDDPNWVAPLFFEQEEKLDLKKNPFFKRGEAALFVAYRNGRPVGRISAQIDHEHLRYYRDDCGFFGFFDTIDDDEVGKALVAKAEAWLKERGMKRIRGPLSFTINDELGVLIDGFDTPPSLMMNHHGQWQDRVAKSAGLEKVEDLFAWKYEVGKIPERALNAWKDVLAMPEVRLRTVTPSKLDEELKVILDIYNEAWKDSWGYLPPTKDEAKKMGQDLKLILDKQLAFIAEINGRPMAMCIALPNLNEIIHDFGGRLTPVNIAKLLYRLKWKGPKTARLMMLGIRTELRGVRRYAGLSHALYVEVAKRAEALGYTGGELSWTRESAKPVNTGIRSMGAKVYKTYRMYEKDLHQSAVQGAGA